MQPQGILLGVPDQTSLLMTKLFVQGSPGSPLSLQNSFESIVQQVLLYFGQISVELPIRIFHIFIEFILDQIYDLHHAIHLSVEVPDSFREDALKSYVSHLNDSLGLHISYLSHYFY